MRGILFSLALLWSPRAFRRRFGAEMRDGNAELLRAPPYRDDGRLMNVWTFNTKATSRATRCRRPTSSTSRK